MKTKIGRLKKSTAILHDIKQGCRLFRRFNKYIFHYWKFELLLLILGNSSIVLSLAEPYIGKNALDKGILSKNMKVFTTYVIWGIGIYAFNLIIGNIHRYLKNYTIRRVRVDLAKDVFKRIRKYPLGVFQDSSTGRYIFRISNDVTDASNVINNTLPNLISYIFKLILITIIIALINWKILILIAVYQLLVLTQVSLFIKRIGEINRLTLERSEDIFKRLNEVFSHIYLVKAFGTMAREASKFLHDLIERMRVEIMETKLNIASDILQNTANKLFFGIISFYGSILVIKGEMTLGSLGATMAYITQGVGAYAALTNLGQQIVLNRIPLERVASLFDVDIDLKENNDSKDMIFRKGEIEFRNVTFGYKKDKHILHNMNFCVSSNMHIAIAGPSGCGKTTILNLILRLYDVDEGVILLDGCDIRELKFKSIYSQIAIAGQQPFLWDDTVKNNISYAQQNASLDQIIEAAHIAEAHNFILGLGKGYDTVIGENACKISEGQKQRIAIARAVIRKPKILILDEAMSSLDSEAGDKITDNIRAGFRDSTVIIVSHRLSALKKMDRVYFFESSGNMDSGTHSELLAQNKKYRELFAGQIEKEAQIGVY